MKALQLTALQTIGLVDVPEPAAPPPGHALVRTLRVGVCGSDLHAYNGRQMFVEFPRILGHELAVEVLSAPEGSGFAAGDIACVNPFVSCGECHTCLAGRTNCCTRLRTLGVHIDGGMCERFTLPAAKLNAAAGLTPEQLATVEPLCIGHHAVRRGAPQPGERVLVIGAGPIGLAVFEGLRGSGARVTVAERSPTRRRFLTERLGHKDVVESTEGLLAELVVDATGSPAAMSAAPLNVTHGGRLVYVGHQPGDISLHNPLLHAREVTVLFSRNANETDFGWVISRLQQKVIDSTPWIAPLTAPGDVAASFPIWLDPEQGIVKPVIAFS
ncbi:MAG: alcohol dehydrogenase catalytic domain-containing protein [Acidobacteriota bacterium]